MIFLSKTKSSKTIVKISARGMITLPLGIRKKFHLQEGTTIALLDDEGRLLLVPIIDINDHRNSLPRRAEMVAEFEQDHVEELELEK
jgi:AbrB family looped-hinge helix DNA binding protein